MHITERRQLKISLSPKKTLKLSILRGINTKHLSFTLINTSQREAPFMILLVLYSHSNTRSLVCSRFFLIMEKTEQFSFVRNLTQIVFFFISNSSCPISDFTYIFLSVRFSVCLFLWGHYLYLPVSLLLSFLTLRSIDRLSFHGIGTAIFLNGNLKNANNMCLN